MCRTSAHGRPGGDRLRGCGSPRLWTARVALSDVPQVAQREGDSPAIQVKRNLFAVSARPECALRHPRQSEIAEKLGSFRRSEDSGQVASFSVTMFCHI